MKSNIRKVEVEKVIIIEELQGDGSKDNPLVVVKLYYDFNGKYLFTIK